MHLRYVALSCFPCSPVASLADFPFHNYLKESFRAPVPKISEDLKTSSLSPGEDSFYRNADPDTQDKDFQLPREHQWRLDSFVQDHDRQEEKDSVNGPKQFQQHPVEDATYSDNYRSTEPNAYPERLLTGRFQAAFESGSSLPGVPDRSRPDSELLFEKPTNVNYASGKRLRRLRLEGTDETPQAEDFSGLLAPFGGRGFDNFLGSAGEGAFGDDDGFRHPAVLTLEDDSAQKYQQRRVELVRRRRLRHRQEVEQQQQQQRRWRRRQQQHVKGDDEIGVQRRLPAHLPFESEFDEQSFGTNLDSGFIEQHNREIVTPPGADFANLELREQQFPTSNVGRDPWSEFTLPKALSSPLARFEQEQTVEDNPDENAYQWPDTRPYYANNPPPLVGRRQRAPEKNSNTPFASQIHLSGLSSDFVETPWPEDSGLGFPELQELQQQDHRGLHGPDGDKRQQQFSWDDYSAADQSFSRDNENAQRFRDPVEDYVRKEYPKQSPPTFPPPLPSPGATPTPTQKTPEPQTSGYKLPERLNAPQNVEGINSPTPANQAVKAYFPQKRPEAQGAVTPTFETRPVVTDHYSGIPTLANVIKKTKEETPRLVVPTAAPTIVTEKGSLNTYEYIEGEKPKGINSTSSSTKFIPPKVQEKGFRPLLSKSEQVFLDGLDGSLSAPPAPTEATLQSKSPLVTGKKIPPGKQRTSQAHYNKQKKFSPSSPYNKGLPGKSSAAFKKGQRFPFKAADSPAKGSSSSRVENAPKRPPASKSGSRRFRNNQSLLNQSIPPRRRGGGKGRGLSRKNLALAAWKRADKRRANAFHRATKFLLEKQDVFGSGEALKRPTARQATAFMFPYVSAAVMQALTA